MIKHNNPEKICLLDGVLVLQGGQYLSGNKDAI